MSICVLRHDRQTRTTSRRPEAKGTFTARTVLSTPGTAFDASDALAYVCAVF